MKITTDLHQTGLFAVKHPNGTILLDTFAATPYSARAEFRVRHNRSWRSAVQLGYTMAGFAQTMEVKIPQGDSPTADVATNVPKADDIIVPKSADEWDFYSDKPGAEDAAQELGDHLESMLKTALEAGLTTVAEGVSIRDRMYALMNSFDGIGARDTEPECILVRTIEESLGLPDNSISR